MSFIDKETIAKLTRANRYRRIKTKNEGTGVSP